jgi:DNA primase catalytic core
MARIPEEEIERVKREVSLRALVEGAGVGLARHGVKDEAGRCPFHEGDETPSLIVTESKGVFHCLGCGAGGSAIDWVMRTEAVSFREAAERLLARLTGERLPGEELARRVEGEAGGAALVEQVVELYHARATLRPEACVYLRSRGISRAEELIRRYRLGQADRTLGYGLTAKLRDRLQALGFIRASGHEHFSGCVVVPVFDDAGQVGEVYGRKVGANFRKGTPLHLYLPGPHRGVWNAEAISRHREVVVCEGFVDALTFVDRGFDNATWVYGVEGLTPDHLAAFEQHAVERVLLAYDGDAAGDRGAERHAERLLSVGIECFRIPIPRGHDVNSYARQVADATDALGALVRRAEWMGKGARPVVAVSEPEADVEVAQELPPALVASSAAVLPIEPAAPEPEPPPASPEPPPASPMPTVPALEIACEISGEDVWFTFGDRRYRVRGLDKTGGGQMRVQVLAVRGVELHTDTLDLQLSRARKDFAREAAAEIGVKDEALKRDLGRMLFKLEQLRDERERAALAAKETEPALTDEERAEALELLRDPALLSRILADFERCGVVGEETSKLVGYLAAVSRKLGDPLAVIIQSSSAAGKTSLMEAVLAFVPEEERVKYSAVTGQSLFYMSDTDLRHKVLALVEEEGAERASYALKLLQSEGELTIASTGKDPQTGRLVTHEYRVEGPVALLLTTTAVEVDEELQNRSIVLTVDEEREQTRAIHRMQRERRTLEGLLARRQRDDVLRLHRNAQRLLRPVPVVNPYARDLTFLDSKTRTRRDHEKYLTLIEAIAQLHQYQRETRTVTDRGQAVRYIEVTREDIEVANRLASEVLGRSLDELAPKTRRLVERLDEVAREACERDGLRREEYRFTQRDVRAATLWSATQVGLHLQRLVDLEYAVIHRGGRGQSFCYELLYDGAGREGEPFLMGLIDAGALRAGYDSNRSGSEAGWSEENEGWSEGGPPEVPPRSGGGPRTEIGVNASGNGHLREATPEEPENAYMGAAGAAQSYVPRSHSGEE